MSASGLATLSGLAFSDTQAGISSASARLFIGTVLSLAFEAEVRALGLPVEGHGFATRPVGWP